MEKHSIPAHNNKQTGQTSSRASATGYLKSGDGKPPEEKKDAVKKSGYTQDMIDKVWIIHPKERTSKYIVGARPHQHTHHSGGTLEINNPVLMEIDWGKGDFVFSKIKLVRGKFFGNTTNAIGTSQVPESIAIAYYDFVKAYL